VAVTTRDRILDAALDLFADEGIAGTTISAIERRAGLAAGSGSLYRHFRSKEDVLEATLVREVARLKAVVDQERAALPRLPDRRSQLLLAFHQALHDVRRFDQLLRILQRDPNRTAALPGVITRVLGIDRSLAAWSGDDHMTDAEGLDPKTVLIVVAALIGYNTLEHLQDEPFNVDADQFVERLVDLVTR
jgi:AcrR family transcriptional regulator